MALSANVTTMRSILNLARELDVYFARESPVHHAARALSQQLTDLEIPFAIAGALAANAHGYLRATSDVDVLLHPDGLARFKEQGMRDTIHNVKIDVLLVGDFPGDGKPKPVQFPDPVASSQAGEDGVPTLRLDVLLELKIASGMTAPHRPQDLADAIQLIKVNGLPQDFHERLHPYVREKFGELWQYAQIEEDY